MSCARFVAITSLMLVFSACFDGNTALLRASREGRVDDVRILLEDGASVDTSDDDGVTPLMETVQNGNLDIVKALLDAGVDVNAQDNWNETALKKAKKNGHNDIVELLKQAGGSEIPNNWKDLYNNTH